MKWQAHRRHRLAAQLTVLVVCLVGATSVLAEPPTPIRSVPVTAFRPVDLPRATTTPTDPPPPIVEVRRIPIPSRAAVAQPSAKIKAIAKGSPKFAQVGRSVRGKASWYCNYDDTRHYPWSVCMAKHPDLGGDDLYAAACGKLRRAMGGDANKYWRNKRVVVGRTGSTRQVTVVLADYCASEDKTIDLYRDAMDRLGPSRGGYNVRVTW